MFFAALVATERLGLEGRAERLVATALLSNLFAVLPIYLLGGFGVLDRTSFAVLVALGTSGAVVAGRGRWKAIGALARELAHAPVAVVRDTLREGGPIGLFAIALIGYTAFSLYAAFFAPTWKSFDATWYHEPIVALTIQNKGFAWVDVPPELDVVNANPRAGEMLQVFFALYGGRRLVELATSFTFAGTGVALYALVGRFTKSAAVRFALGATVLLVPAFFLQLGSTYIDVHVTGLLVAAAFFATSPRVGRAELLLVAVASCLAMGTKATTYVPGGILLVSAALRHAATRGARTIPAAAGALLVSPSLAYYTFARNWVHYKNPFFPIPVSLPKAGIDWPGLGKPFESEEVLAPFEDVWKNALGQPVGDGRYNYPFYVLPHTAREAASSFNYGYAVAWVLVPFGCIGLAYLTLRAIASVGMGWRREDLQRAKMVAMVALPVVAHVETLHYLHLARYHGLSLTLLAVAIAAAVEALRVRSWGLALSGAALLLSGVSLALQEPRCFLLPRDVEAMLAIPYPDRETTPELGSPTTLQGGTFRAQNFRRGTVVAYTDSLQTIAPLWNDAYSNKVVYVHDDARLIGELDRAGARYFVCAAGCGRHPQIRASWRPTQNFLVFSPGTTVYARP